MRIVCQQTILMKYHGLFVIFEKAANLKLLSAAKCRWRLKETGSVTMNIFQKKNSF